MVSVDFVLYLLLALLLKGLRENGGGQSHLTAVGRRTVVSILVVETSLHVHVRAAAALYPTLTPKAGLLLGGPAGGLPHTPADGACHKDTLRLQRALKNRTLWAERSTTSCPAYMVDASAHGVVGGLWGARYQLGSFDACLSAGEASPVGARYCLASLSVVAGPHHAPPQPQHRLRHRRRVDSQPHSCDSELGAGAGPSSSWDHVTALDPERDAWEALRGCRLAEGAVPLGDVLVALCVPASCGPASLEAALQAALSRRASAPGPAFAVRVAPEHCADPVGPGPDGPDGPGTQGVADYPAQFFWAVVAVLSATVVLAPYQDWAAWDWRIHLWALSRPEAPLAGVDLGALAGVRAANMALLLVTHRSFNSERFPASNRYNTAQSRMNPWHSIGHHATLMVDTCFFMAGLLMLLSLAARRCGGRGSPLRAVALRFLRLTPSYVLVLMFYATAMQSLGSGPLWTATTLPEAAACRRWWWANLLYINNYVPAQPSEPMCMLQSWSMAVDMQLFALGSVLLPPLLDGAGQAGQARWARWAWAGLALAMAPPFVATLRHAWGPMLLWSPRALRNPFAEPMFYAMYVPTHMRAAPYVVGVLTGCVMLRIKARGLLLSRTATLLGTWGSLLLMALVLVSCVRFGDLSRPPVGALAAALYASLSPALWAAGLGALVVALSFGQHTAVAGLLRWQPLVTLSRLSYGVYLVHFALQLLQAGAERNPVHVSVLTLIRGGASDLVISLIISLWLYVAVEAPVRQLAKAALATAPRVAEVTFGTPSLPAEEATLQKPKTSLISPIKGQCNAQFSCF